MREHLEQADAAGDFRIDGGGDSAGLRMCGDLEADIGRDAALFPVDSPLALLVPGAVHLVRSVSGAAGNAGNAVNKPENDACGLSEDAPDIPPFGCLLHILRMLASDESGPGGALVRRGIAWIGDRVHPDMHALRCASVSAGHDPSHDQHHGWSDEWMHAANHAAFCSEDMLARHCVLVRDGSDAVGAGASVYQSGREHRHKPGRAQTRVWCAEQALRLGAAGIVIVDGSGFDTLAWRKLQLAAAQGGGSSDTQRQHGTQRALVIVVAPPETGAVGSSCSHRGSHRGSHQGSHQGSRVGMRGHDGPLRMRGCGASTRWSVRPACMDAGANGSLDQGLDLRWRMTLEFARTIPEWYASGRDGADGAASMRSRLEAGLIALDIVVPRRAVRHVSGGSLQHGRAEWIESIRTESLLRAQAAARNAREAAIAIRLKPIRLQSSHLQSSHLQSSHLQSSHLQLHDAIPNPAAPVSVMSHRVGGGQETPDPGGAPAWPHARSA